MGAAVILADEGEVARLRIPRRRAVERHRRDAPWRFAASQIDEEETRRALTRRGEMLALKLPGILGIHRRRTRRAYARWSATIASHTMRLSVATRRRVLENCGYVPRVR